MLDLDALVDLDSPDWGLDGESLAAPVPAPGGRPVRIATKKPRPFAVIHVRIVGHAHTELGPLDAHAEATITRLGVAHSSIRLVARALEHANGQRLNELRRQRDDAELFFLVDGDAIWFVELDDIEVEIANLLGGTT